MPRGYRAGEAYISIGVWGLARLLVDFRSRKGVNDVLTKFLASDQTKKIQDIERSNSEPPIQSHSTPQIQ